MAPGNPPSNRGSRGPSGPGGPTGPQRRSALGGAAGGRPAAPGTTSAAAAGGAAAGQTRRAAARPKGKRRLIDYPRQGKRGIRRWLPSWRLVLGTFLTFVALGIGAFVYAYASTDIPPASEFAKGQTTTVYYSDGATVLGTFGEQNRVIVESSAIPDHVKAAVVAGEDRSFYENPGINPTGILRALWNNVRGGDKQGGSSITQQYAERYYFDSTVSDYRGKLKEALLAIKLDRQQDKDEILSTYLNTIYFGRDSYGVETAAQSYFGVSVTDLDVSQAALLAGVIPSPNNFDPRIDPVQAERRWNYVVDGMVETGALTQAERDALVYPQTIEFARSDTLGGPEGYLLDEVRKEILAKSPITADELNLTGYKIVSTIDVVLQPQAVAAVQSLPADKDPRTKTALVTVNPADGSIVTMYGGPDFVTQPRNAVTQDAAQAGSTFKPFTLTAYLEQGGSLKSRYNGNSLIEVEGFPDPVRNFGRGNGESFGEIDVVKATANSVNSVYAAMNMEVGPAATLDAARRAGVNESSLEGQDVAANVLGTASPTPLEMAESFNTFAAQGMHMDTFIVRSVEYLDGGLVYEGGSAPERVFAEDVMADVTYAMTQVVENGTAEKAQAVGHPIAGKTGTSNENKSAWFIGYTRHLTTAVAMYQVAEDGSPMTITPFAGYGQITGGSAPLDVWTAYMTQAMQGREVLEFPERADVGEPNRPPLVDVPSVVGLPLGEALAALEGAGFTVAVQEANDPNVPQGNVISQSPGGGQAEQGTSVTVVVSTGPGTAAIPNVTGMGSAAARSALEGAGFAVAVTTQESATIPADQVISQNPGGGTEAAPGSTVTIVVSSGPPAVEEPPGEEPPVVPPPDPGGGETAPLPPAPPGPGQQG